MAKWTGSVILILRPWPEGSDHALGATGSRNQELKFPAASVFRYAAGISPWVWRMNGNLIFNHAQRQAHRDRQIRVSRLAAAMTCAVKLTAQCFRAVPCDPDRQITSD